MVTVFHKLTDIIDWVFGFTYLFVGVYVAGNTVSAQTNPASAQTNPAPQSSPVDLSNWNTQVVVIGLGVVAILAKLIDSFIHGYKQYVDVQSNSNHGKLVQCLAKMEEERKSANEALLAERTSHLTDVSRLTAQYQAMLVDYESRLATKRDENEYLRTMLAADRDIERNLRLANEELTAKLIAQTQAFLDQNSQITFIANQSVKNTHAALNKIPRKAGSDADVATTSAPVRGAGVTVGSATGGEADGA